MRISTVFVKPFTFDHKRPSMNLESFITEHFLINKKLVFGQWAFRIENYFFSKGKHTSDLLLDLELLPLHEFPRDMRKLLLDLGELFSVMISPDKEARLSIDFPDSGPIKKIAFGMQVVFDEDLSFELYQRK